MVNWRDDTFQETIAQFPHNLEGGMAACEHLLSVPGMPWSLEDQVRQNQTWYAQPLEPLGDVIPIQIPHRDGWSLFNPSIAADEAGRLKMIVRSSNYRIAGDGRYEMPGDGVIRTTNVLCSVNDQLEITHHLTLPPPIDFETKDLQRFPLVLGCEDARLYDDCGAWNYVATVRQLNAQGICQQVRVTVSPDDEHEWQTLSGVREHNKNWMPLHDRSNEKAFIDRVYPTIYRSLDGEDPKMHDAPYILRTARGGACAWERGTRLCLVHEAVTMTPVYEKIYLHRFVRFGGPTGSVLHVSDPFVFEKRQIEFAAGLVRLGDDYVISYGVRDEEARLLRIPWRTVFPLLRLPYDEEDPSDLSASSLR